MGPEQRIPPALGEGVSTSPGGHGGMRAGRRASPSRSPASLPSSQSPAAAFSCGRVPHAGAVPGCAAGSAVGVPREQKYPPTTTQALVTGTKATAPAPRMRLGHRTPHAYGQSCRLGWPSHPWSRRGRAFGSPGFPKAGCPSPSWRRAPHSSSTDRADSQVGSAGDFPNRQHLQQAPGRVSPS